MPLAGPLFQARGAVRVWPRDCHGVNLEIGAVVETGRQCWRRTRSPTARRRRLTVPPLSRHPPLPREMGRPMDTGYERLAMQSFGLDGFDIGPDTAILAVGAESKTAVGLLADGSAYLSAPVGSLSTPDEYRRFEALLTQAARRLPGPPHAVAHDLHPTYFSTQIAHRLGYPLVGVQHHFAHLAALMVDRAEPGPIVGLACDGWTAPSGAARCCISTVAGSNARATSRHVSSRSRPSG